MSRRPDVIVLNFHNRFLNTRTSHKGQQHPHKITNDTTNSKARVIESVEYHLDEANEKFWYGHLL